jgi:two-component system, NtrC family, response regulator GlrR
MIRMLIVDDDETILKLIRMRLEIEGYEVTTAPSAQKALALTRDNAFDIAIVDFKLTDRNGVALMEDLLHLDPEMPVIILTAYGTIKGAVEAVKKGAYGYLTKPFDYDELLLHIRNCYEKRGLSLEVRRLRNLVGERYGLDNIIGVSDAMKKVLDRVAQAAQVDSYVYISGESGTGKELVAKTLHLASSRKEGPFLPVNCAAIPESLMESELFGYEKGAFTGATKSRRGLFAQADGGTLFLDEISELPFSMQSKLLRAIGERAFHSLGSNKMIEVDARIVAASNKNLRAEVEKGRFREDLFYRIHVISIRIPPLRERKEDIPLLARHFLRIHSKRTKKELIDFSPGAMQKLVLHHWPGNVRELGNCVESAVAMAYGKMITDDLIPLGKGAGQKGPKSFKSAKAQFEKQYLVQLMQITKGNITEAAKLAGKHRADLYELLKKHDVEPDTFRDTRPGHSD